MFVDENLEPIPKADLIIDAQIASLIMNNRLIGEDILREAVEAEAGAHLFNPDLISKLGLLVEVQVRHVLESSFRFMCKDKRDVIEPEDVLEAVKDNGHHDLMMDYLWQTEKDQYYTTQHESFQQEIQMLQAMSIQQPTLQGKWIYINGKIPTLSQNIELKSLSQQISDNEKKHTLHCIIKDDPLSLLSTEQAQYFQQMSQAIRMNVNPKGTFTLDGDLNSLLPFFLKFLGETPLNETGVWFLMKLIQNKFIWQAIEYNLKKILILLLAYRGEYSFEVGVKIANLVQKFEVKYPMLRDIFVGYADESYSTLLKRIPMELQLGIVLPINEQQLQRCRKDVQANDDMAKKFLDTLQLYSSSLKHFREILMRRMNTYVYWHPCNELRNDPYLRMI